MKYYPSPTPRDENQLRAYVQRELNKLAQVINQIHLHEPLHAEPDNPQLGQVEYADGTNWNPGATGQGLYEYDGTGWNKL